MKQNQSSITAQGIAMIRALESRKPADQRVCYDPLAHSFVNPLLLLLGPLLNWYGARRSPGVAEFLVARARYFDDTITSYLHQGIQQLVILGAGYDSRAYRLEALKSLKHIFEVDHPATQAMKLKRLKQASVTVPANVIYVPIDFMTQQLTKLFDYGYQSDLLTLFVWEGVTYYISAEAVDQTLSFINQSALPGSAIIFDYAYAEALASAHPRAEVSSMRRYRRFTGENLIFGIPQGTIAPFLTQRGFTHITNITHTDLHQLYFQDKTPARQVAPIYAIASAQVSASKEPTPRQ